ncbi:MAG: hypothetical protein WCL71_12895 [Deltaproteobacteria bacterium]
MRMEWGELASHLGLSRSMLDFARKGQRNLSFKALNRIEQAERDAGISSPSPPPHTLASAPEGTPIKNSTISEKGNEKGIDREELRRTIDDLKRLLGDLERIYKRK